MLLEEDSPFGLLEFALDRPIPDWIPADWDMPVLDLGPGNKTIQAAARYDYPEWDLEGYDGKLLQPLPYGDDSVGGVYAINLLEHLNDPRPLIREVSRILAPECAFTIFVPHARSGMYLQDLDHKTPFILDTWKNHVEPHKYYEKGREDLKLRIGFNALFAIKEENVGILTQLIKQ